MEKLKKQSDFARRLNEFMVANKMTVRDAAKVAGIGVSKVQSWRTGTLPTDYDAVRKLAQRFGTSLSFLLTGHSDESPGATGTMLVSEVFGDGGMIFDGYCQVTIKRLVPKKGGGDA